MWRTPAFCCAALTGGMDPYSLDRIVCSAGLVMNWTNFSAAERLCVSLKMAMLMPATIESTLVPCPGAPDWTGTGATPYWLVDMPWAFRLAPAACHISIAALPLAKSETDWFWSYSASPGDTILSVPIRLTNCWTPCTHPGRVYVGAPDGLKKLQPCCWAKMNALWMFSGMLPASRARPYTLPWVSFLPSAIRSAQVAGGPLMPACANSALL